MSVLLDVMLIMQIDGNSIIPYDQICHKYLTVILLYLVLAVLSLVSNIYFPKKWKGSGSYTLVSARYLVSYLMQVLSGQRCHS